MNNLSIFFLGLVLIYIPACLSEKCFSQKLGYPCCTHNNGIYTNMDGTWGIENGDWCGIVEPCFSEALGYKCCNDDKVLFIDESGQWGVENGEWCGISSNVSDSCFCQPYGYKCCESCNAVVTDESGDWGVENNEWCGLKFSCYSPEPNYISDFDFVFLKKEIKEKNMIYSPLSIKYALKMLLEGAEKNTFYELNNIVGNTTVSKYNNIENILSLANSVFVRSQFYQYVKPEYINVLEEKYNAEVIKDNFENAININQWIEEKTFKILRNVVKDSVVQDPLCQILLINALAIDMKWGNNFSPSNTEKENFYLDDGSKMDVAMMNKKEVKDNGISYYIGDSLTVLTMDYEKYGNTNLEFMAIMPDKNLSNFVENVTEEQIKQLDKKLISSTKDDGINIKIPKFNFEYNLPLRNDLKYLGVKDAFNKTTADFTKMVNMKEMLQKPFVQDMIHKAKIEFTEKGTKAAAVTVVVVGGLAKALPPPPKYPVNVYINKPFMFIIRDKYAKDVWFTGTVFEPMLWKDNPKENESDDNKTSNSGSKTLPTKTLPSSYRYKK